jgi:hypothetical protein
LTQSYAYKKPSISSPFPLRSRSKSAARLLKSDHTAPPLPSASFDVSGEPRPTLTSLSALVPSSLPCAPPRHGLMFVCAQFIVSVRGRCHLLQGHLRRAIQATIVHLLICDSPSRSPRRLEPAGNRAMPPSPPVARSFQCQSAAAI